MSSVSSRVVSPYLASMSIVYAWAPDRAYANGTIGAWAKEHKLNTARYPAGMAAYWNWEVPSGYMGVASLGGNWSKAQQAPVEDWMSMTEYLDLCRSSGMRPLIGVNYNCNPYTATQPYNSRLITRQEPFAVTAWGLTLAAFVSAQVTTTSSATCHGMSLSRAQCAKWNSL